MKPRNPFAPAFAKTASMTSVGALVTTASDFLRHLSDDDAAFSGETARINALDANAIPMADLLEFSHLLDAYTVFSTQARKTASDAMIPIMTKSDDQLIVFEKQLRAWQEHTAKLGFPAIAPIIPRDSAEHPGNEPGFTFGLDGSTKFLIAGGLVLAALLIIRR